MNLKNLSNEQLIVNTKSLARVERETLTRVLFHLQEIERRRLFSEFKCGSLFEFAVRILRYSEDQACRRIAAMKLLRALPELEARINSGDLSLSHIGLAQTLFRQEKKNHHELSKAAQLDILNQMANKSVRDARGIANAHSSTQRLQRPDRIRPIAEDRIEVTFEADAILETKLQQLKGLLAHRSPSLSLGELVLRLCDVGLQVWDPTVPVTSRVKQARASVSAAGNPGASDVEQQSTPHDSYQAIRRRVFRRAAGRCEICSSQYALEIDHIVPQAQGGSSEETNLRVLCRSCNQKAAIDAFGLSQMEKYLRKSSAS